LASHLHLKFVKGGTYPEESHRLLAASVESSINFFPEERPNQLLLDLSLNLKCFVSQRLVHTEDGKRAAAIEILLGTPTVAQAIHKGEIETIKEIMSKSENLGMQTFDSALFKLYESGKISFEDALKNADSANNLRLQIKLRSSRGIPEGNVEEVKKEEQRSSFSLSTENDDDEQIFNY
jgi:twitching motility protein PilU